MADHLTEAEIIALLDLTPLPSEGGYFRQTVMVQDAGPGRFRTPLHTAILFLVTRESWSGLHMLESDELFHFYMGDECRMVVCSADGALEERRLGTNVQSGALVQTLVAARMWQGTRLAEGGAYGYALLGTTMTPGFRQDQFRLAQLADLESFPPAVAVKLSEFLSPER